jgi:hypothetical protein
MDLLECRPVEGHDDTTGPPSASELTANSDQKATTFITQHNRIQVGFKDRRVFTAESALHSSRANHLRHNPLASYPQPHCTVVSTIT